MPEEGNLLIRKIVLEVIKVKIYDMTMLQIISPQDIAKSIEVEDKVYNNYKAIIVMLTHNLIKQM